MRADLSRVHRVTVVGECIKSYKCCDIYGALLMLLLGFSPGAQLISETVNGYRYEGVALDAAGSLTIP